MKKYLNKYVITSTIFILFITIIGGTTYIRNLKTLYKSVRNSTSLLQLRDNIDEVFSKNLTGFNNFIEVYSMSELVLDVQIFEDAEYGYLIKDNNGLLHFPYNLVDVTPYSKKLINFDKELKKMNIPLLYVQAPNKNLKGYTVYPEGAYNYANENADSFLEKIRLDDVNVLDLREEIENDKLDKSKLFYKTDHHWTTQTAFWAFKKIVTKLNSDYEFNIDSDDYYGDINNYKTTKYEKCFLGAIGRRLERFAAGIDDYIFIEPIYDTDFDIYYPPSSTEIPFRHGNFMNSVAYETVLKNEDIKTNRHAAYFEYDYGHLIIKNKLIDNDIKILLIKDSFALPTAAFLSTCVEELHMIDLRAEGAPVPVEYVEQNDFDAVIILYNTEVFGNPMFNLSGN